MKLKVKKRRKRRPKKILMKWNDILDDFEEPSEWLDLICEGCLRWETMLRAVSIIHTPTPKVVKEYTAMEEEELRNDRIVLFLSEILAAAVRHDYEPETFDELCTVFSVGIKHEVDYCQPFKDAWYMKQTTVAKERWQDLRGFHTSPMFWFDLYRSIILYLTN